MLIFLFGLAGAGKSYTGEIIEKKFGYHFWEADDALTDEMKDFIRKDQPFTQEMRDDFFAIVAHKIDELLTQHSNVVVAQALYKEKNREELISKFKDIQFIWVKSQSELMRDRIKRRYESGDGINPEYAAKIGKLFENPQIISHEILYNNSDETSIAEQLELLGIRNNFHRQQLSSIGISKGSYTHLLNKFEKILPDLLLDQDNWESLNVDYEQPRVERVWKQFGEYRIYLHYLHTANIDQVLYHPHPWPSAIRIVKGSYDMSVGYAHKSDESEKPPIAITCHLAEGSTYEMVDPKAWHYVCPKDQGVYSVMITGRPWPGCDKKSDLKLQALTDLRKKEIIEFFLSKYIANEKIETQISQTTYLFEGNEAIEKERLRRLNELYNPNSKKVLKKYLKEDMTVLEIGPGTGELGEWIKKKIGNGNYVALDIDQNVSKFIREKIPDSQIIMGSMTNIDQISELKDKKFDIIYFRWVLAYTPKDQFVKTLSKLYSRLKSGGYLICEECDVYKSYCSLKNSASKITVVAFDKWLELSRQVQNFEGVDADFAIGSKIKSLLIEATGSNNVETHVFQPNLRSVYYKEIPPIAMRAAKGFLDGKKIRKSESLENITNGLEKIAVDSAINVHYLENTTALVKK